MPDIKITGGSDTRELAILSLAHFTNDGLVLLLPVLTPLIGKDLGLSYIEIGLLATSILVSHGIGQFFFGYYSDRIKSRSDLVTSGLVLSSLSIYLVGISNSYFQLQVLAVLTGFTTSVYHPVGFSILSTVFGNKGKAIGVHGAAGSIGLVVFPVIAGFITEEYGWRLVFRLVPFIGFTSGMLYFMLTKGLRNDTVEFRTKINLRFFTKDILAIIFIYSITTMVAFGFTTFLPVKLSILNYSPSLIGIFISVFFGVGIIGQYIGGVLADKVSLKMIISISLAITAFFILFFINSISQVYLIIFLIAIGFFCALPCPANIVRYTNNTQPGTRGTSLGIFFGIGGFFGALTPVIMGYITEKIDLWTAFLFLPLLCLAGVIVMSGYKD